MLNQRSRKFLLRLRILAALLLASLAWASTVEFTHHHGLRNARVARSTEFANSTNTANDETRIEDTNSPQSSSRSNTGAECSICQLHHNLATTLLSKLAESRSDVAQATSITQAAAIHLSEIPATQRGRAPPSLL